MLAQISQMIIQSKKQVILAALKLAICKQNGQLLSEKKFGKHLKKIYPIKMEKHASL